MKKMQFSIEIQAPRAKVWKILWEDKTFRDWGSIIDEGQYMVGELAEGNEVQFISSENGLGVTSVIEKLIPHTYIAFRQVADTMNSGKELRDKEWTGGTESFELAVSEGAITLTVTIDIPPGLEEIFEDRFPKALERVKILAEKNE